MPRRIESHLLPGPAGKLEALLEEPEDGETREAVLVCHPHPLHGGTMQNAARQFGVEKIWPEAAVVYMQGL